MKPTDALVRNFLEKKCCKRKCCDSFSAEELVQYRLECHELDYYDEIGNRLDLVILGALRTITKTHNKINHARKIHEQVRILKKKMYTLRGEKVCEKMFVFAYGIGRGERWKRLSKSFASDGIHVKSHGNRKRQPKHSLTLENRNHIVNFIRNYAEEAALFLPGRQANQRSIVKLLPSNETKINIYRRYEEACKNSGFEATKLTTFRLTWRDFCSDIVIQRPRTDLCADCQASYVSHSKLNGKSEQEKANFFETCRKHLSRVDVERRHYFNTIQETRASLAQEDRKKEIFEIARAGLHCNVKDVVHYSFDYAQQMHIPNLPQQPGPIYFLTPFKIGLFGVMNDTFNYQGNYVIPESVVTGKGSNTVVSYLHDFLEADNCGITDLSLHADNCCAQNKNHTMIYYLMFRVLLGLNKKITLNFLPVGHTKFSVDWAFGLIKKRIKVTDAHDIDDICDIISQSTKLSNVNQPFKTGTEDGNSLIDVYDWSTFFQKKKWKRIPLITSYFHFTIDKKKPGYVLCQSTLDDVGKSIQIVNISHGKRILFTSWPKVVVPDGITEVRKKYLKDSIIKYAKSDSNLVNVFSK